MDLARHCQQAAALVSTWPEWKRNVLGEYPKMRQKKTPDEQGWYWLCLGDVWWMAFVDTLNDTIVMFNQDNPREEYMATDIDAWLEPDQTWYGPLNCPGGDFGGDTVVLSEETHTKAKLSGSAIVLKHIDYTHCKDRKGGGTITTVAHYEDSESAHKAINLGESEAILS